MGTRSGRRDSSIRRRQRRLLLPNVLVAFLNRDGWWATYAFHSERGADLGSIWGLVLSDGISPRTLNLFTGLLFVLSGVAVLESGGGGPCERVPSPSSQLQGHWLPSSCSGARSLRRSTRSGCFPCSCSCPLACSGGSHGRVGVFVYAVSFGVGLDGYEAETAPSAIKAAALTRAVVLAALVVVFLRARAPDRLQA